MKTVRFSLRLPAELHEKLKNATQNDAIGTSINSYILKVLGRKIRTSTAKKNVPNHDKDTGI